MCLAATILKGNKNSASFDWRPIHHFFLHLNSDTLRAPTLCIQNGPRAGHQYLVGARTYVQLPFGCVLSIPLSVSWKINVAARGGGRVTKISNDPSFVCARKVEGRPGDGSGQ